MCLALSPPTLGTADAGDGGNVTLGYLYFLFEHKSYVEKDILFQLMKYMADIWQTVVKQGEKELPLIMTIAFQSVFQRGTAGRDARSVILRAGEYLRHLEDQQDAMDCFKTLLHYLLREGRPLSREQVEEAALQLKGIYGKGSEFMKSTLDLLREEGKLEGKLEGTLEGKADALIKQLMKRFHVLPDELKDKIRKLDAATLDMMLLDIFDYQSLEDVKKRLH